MTTLNWEKLPRGRIGRTLFSHDRLGSVLAQGQLRVDGGRLEELFIQKEAPLARQASRRGSNLDAPAVGSTAGKVSLLDPKRATNVSIIIKQIKRPSRRARRDAGAALLGRPNYEEIPAEELRDAILEANTDTGPFAFEPDPSAVGVQEQTAAEEAEKQRRVSLANQILEIMPQAEDREKLAAWEGDDADLSHADRYMRMLAAIPRLEQRMKCLMFKLRFDDDYSVCVEDLRHLREATDAACGSQHLHALLQAILEVGNELNAGTMKGDAAGFRLSSLVRFVELKSTKDPKVTLLHYVVETLLDNGADALLDVRAHLPHVEEAAKVSLTELQSRYREWVESLDRVDREIVTAEQSRAEIPDEARYTESLTFFYNQASEMQEEFKTSLEQVEGQAARLLQLFGEESGDTEPHSILATLTMFLKRLEKAADEVRRRQEAARANARRSGPAGAGTGSSGPAGAGPSRATATLPNTRRVNTLANAINAQAAGGLQNGGALGRPPSSPSSPLRGGQLGSNAAGGPSRSAGGADTLASLGSAKRPLPSQQSDSRTE